MNDRKYFNSLAHKWDEIVNHDKKKINYILNLLDIKKGDDILDVGTGTGILIPFLLDKIGKNGSILAIDIAEKMLEKARENYPYSNIYFQRTDINDFDLKDSFNLVICYSAFPHFKDKKNVIENMVRSLKDKGKLCICHSQSRDDINNLHRKLDSVVSSAYLPSSNTIRNYFGNKGLCTTKIVDNKEMYVVIGEKR